MRLGLHARFVAILLLAGLIALVALWVIRSEQDTRERAVGTIVTAAMQPATDQQKSAVLESIELADRRSRTELALTLIALGALFALLALWVSRRLLQPIERLADAVSNIEEGEQRIASSDFERDDEIGDIARAFGSINDAFIAMRQRMEHDAEPAEPIVPNLSATVVLPPARVEEPDPSVIAQSPSPLKSASVVAPTSIAPETVVAAKPVVVAKLVVVAPEPTPQEIARRSRLEDDLREAWQRGEMAVLYQPIHSVADGSMRGAEALLRWKHPVDGAIEPAEFIPLAERSELIDTLGRFVLIQACSDASLWPSGGTPDTTPFLSVNVSPRQLQGTQLFETIVEALRKSGLAAARLHLEIPVAALRSDDSAIAATIEQLRGLGARIWLDAVGSDAADQARWMKMSVDGVKVGRSRIAGNTVDLEDAAARDSIVATARALRVVAVVVGVEGLAQLDVLKEQGADLAQGFVLCKPISTAEIGRRLLA